MPRRRTNELEIRPICDSQTVTVYKQKVSYVLVSPSDSSKVTTVCESELKRAQKRNLIKLLCI